MTDVGSRQLVPPDVVGERCVHSLFVNASCRACVDICPQGAWLIGDDSLGIHTDACDGCDLCVPVCPEGAILQTKVLETRQGKHGLVGLCACEKADINVRDGVVPCIHLFGQRELVHIYNRGVRHLVISPGDCENCFRGKVTRLWDTVGELNRMFTSRGMRKFELNIVPPSTWADVLTAHSDTISGIQTGRRGFFYQVVQSAVRAEVEMAETTDSGPGAYPPLGSVLPRNSDDDIFPFLPRIVPGSCNGCDACIRLCPHAAITCEKEEGESGYYLNPDSCTGCGLCVDVCDQGAVKVDRWKCQDQTVVPLASKYCPACGVAYHQPTATINKEGLCRVCAAKGDLRYKLFQVLE